MFPVEKPSLLNDVAREMHGHITTNNEGTLSKLLNEDSMAKIVESTGTRLWEKFMTFGTASAGIIAISIILQVIKMIIDIMINRFLLHRVYRWSIHMVGAVWDSVTQCLIQLGRRTTKPTPAKRYKVQNDIELGQIDVQAELLPNPASSTTQSDTTSDNQGTERENRGRFFSYSA